MLPVEVCNDRIIVSLLKDPSSIPQSKSILIPSSVIDERVGKTIVIVLNLPATSP
ncbi:MAG: hypothetical protein AAGE84_05495 [Cyanobacteria bacterium P01_G01_bin.39]